MEETGAWIPGSRGSGWFLGTGKGDGGGEAATVPVGGKGKGCFMGRRQLWEEHLWEKGEEASFEGDQGDGFISVGAEAGLAQYLRGLWSGANLQPDSLESVHDPQPLMLGLWRLWPLA